MPAGLSIPSGAQETCTTFWILRRFFDDLYRQLLAPDDSVNRRLHVVRLVEGRTYWILSGD
jgi:hypothetical protein